MSEKYTSFDEAIEYLKALSREELIVTLFDTLSPSEKQLCFEAMAYKFLLKHVCK